MIFKMTASNTFKDDLKENPQAAMNMLKSFVYVLNTKQTISKKRNKKYLDLCRKYFAFKKDEPADNMLTLIEFQQNIFKPILSEMIKLKNSKRQVE
tara:strand:+ start:669 stop:956 length:288 start_codon:yes stop_codon:yes gene_type:complete